MKRIWYLPTDDIIVIAFWHRTKGWLLSDGPKVFMDSIAFGYETHIEATIPEWAVDLGAY